MTGLETTRVPVTFKLQLIPKARHHRQLQAALDACRHIYNAGNQERHASRNRFLHDEWVSAERLKNAGLKRAPRRNAKPTLYGQMADLTAIRSFDDEVKDVGVFLARGAIAMLDADWKTVGKPDTLGRIRQPPKYKSRHWDNVLNFRDPRKVKITDKYIVAHPLGAIRYRGHRPLPEGEPVAVKFWRDDRAGDLRDGRGGRWLALVTYWVDVPVDRRSRGRLEGLDVGLEEYVTGTGGCVLQAHRAGREDDAERRLLQRQLRSRRSKDGKPKRALSKRGSHRRRKTIRRLRKLERRVANTRKTHARRAAARVVKMCDGIAIEEPRSLVGLYRTRMARSIYDAGWATFRTALIWACLKAGIPLVTVPAAGTSQDCPACLRKGVFSNALNQRHRTCVCGWTASRDVTSACEILRRGVPELVKKRGGGAPWGHKPPTGGKLVPETPAERETVRRGSPPPSGGCRIPEIQPAGSSP